MNIKTELKNSCVVLIALTLLGGVVYPLLITSIAQALFPTQANGSLIVRDGRIVGSELIGQQFERPEFFWGRLSATSAYPYNAAASSGSNLGPGNPQLIQAAEARVKALLEYEHNMQPIPLDLLTGSASGLDPHISPAAAEYQVPRVARFRHMSEDKLRELVHAATEGRQFGILASRV